VLSAPVSRWRQWRYPANFVGMPDNRACCGFIRSATFGPRRRRVSGHRGRSRDAPIPKPSTARSISVSVLISRDNRGSLGLLMLLTLKRSLASGIAALRAALAEPRYARWWLCVRGDCRRLAELRSALDGSRIFPADGEPQQSRRRYCD
jgi:hypothetical protein